MHAQVHAHIHARMHGRATHTQSTPALQLVLNPVSRSLKNVKNACSASNGPSAPIDALAHSFKPSIVLPPIHLTNILLFVIFMSYMQEAHTTLVTYHFINLHPLHKINLSYLHVLHMKAYQPIHHMMAFARGL